MKPLRQRDRHDRQRFIIDRSAQKGVYLLAGFPVLLVGGLVVLLSLRSWPILQAQNPWQLLTDSQWLPSQNLFGFFPFIMGTCWVTLTAMLMSVPICLLSALYLSEYSHPLTRVMIKPVFDVLAALPSVVYGVWGVLVVVPLVKAAADKLQLAGSTGYSVLAGGIVLAVMVGPYITTITYEILNAVPWGLREASLALGATRWQTIKWVILPKTYPGIIAAVTLGASRALGETMAVLMVVGNLAKVPGSIFDPAYPLPALIANNYGEMFSIPLYESALMTAALILLIMVLIMNLISTLVLKQFIRREMSA